MDPDGLNADAKAAAPKLTIVTVVKDDLPGLEATLASTHALSHSSYEHWVIDGSSRSDVRSYLSVIGDVNWISEPDSGIFDAMNKGLERAQGDFVLFLNAGDVISSALDATTLFAKLSTESRVLVGHTIEVYKDLRWLRPAANRASDVFSCPAHQATFYPRSFYDNNRYLMHLGISADGAYTRSAIRQCGAVYLPLIVCEFILGGVSSNYQSSGVLKQRMREVATLREQASLLLKFWLWHILPKGTFYSLLGAFK
ncbi:MAG: glycosyltransferase, partial [Burkholderiales bacterium]|nr:glycosyltransferase [Phycisphaerae bacterium]